MRFRETLWFKKGITETEAPHEALDTEDADATDELRPIEDSYVDDGALLARGDSMTFGVHTGMTQGIRPFEPVESAGVPEQLLIAELKTGRRVYLAMIAGFVMAVSGLAIFMV